MMMGMKRPVMKHNTQKINNSMADIISFPSDRIKRVHKAEQLLSEDERKALILEEKKATIEGSLEYVTIDSLGLIARLGFDITQENYVKDVTLLVDVIRSLLYRSIGVHHPIHNYVDKNYVITSDGHEGSEYAYNPAFHIDGDEDELKSD